MTSETFSRSPPWETREAEINSFDSTHLGLFSTENANAQSVSHDLQFESVP